jgi:hypothetical protein
MDITMCSGEGCPLKDGCFRARAVAHGRQDWFGAPPFDAKTNSCESFMPLPAATHKQIEEKAHFLWKARQATGQHGTAESDYLAAKQALEERMKEELRW